MTLDEYCKNCTKLVEGKCSIYKDAAKKTAAERGFSIGCAFSVVGSPNRISSDRIRLGQQKGKKSKKSSKIRSDRSYSNRKSREYNVSQTQRKMDARF